MTDEIVVPQTSHIACPDRGFRHRPVSACLACPAFQGFNEVAKAEEQGPELPFEARYRVVCAHPISRRMTIVEGE